jgi:hypothetical protein
LLLAIGMPPNKMPAKSSKIDKDANMNFPDVTAILKKLISCSLALVLLTGATQSLSIDEPVDLMLASAVEAAVDSSMPTMMFDHYGDPASFVKYIIRKPPTHA